MKEFECYSFSRLYKSPNLEFFFILGVNLSEEFDDDWDGRLIEVLGYAVTFMEPESMEQKNLIYLIEKEDRKFEDVIRHAKMFIRQMSVSDDVIDGENFEIRKTNVDGSIVSQPYIDFIKSVTNKQIPEILLSELHSLGRSDEV